MDPTVYLPKKALPLPKRAVIITGADGKRYARFKPRGSRTEADFPLSRDGMKYITSKRKFWGMFSDPVTGDKRRVPLGVSDATIAKKLVKEKFLAAVRIGRDPNFESEHDVLLEKHVAAFTEHLRRPKKNNTVSHVDHTVSRVKAVLLGSAGRHGCGFVYWSDVCADRVADFIDDLISGGASQRTAAHYVQAVRSFGRWMCRSGRVASDSLGRLENVSVTEQDDYRALTDEEVAALIDAAQVGAPVEGVPGSEWAAIFAVAVDSGFRFSEIRSLTWAGVRIDLDDPHLIVRAAYTKNREEAKQPIPAGLAAELQAWRAGQGEIDADAAVFPSLGKWTKPAKAVKSYRQAARARWLKQATSDRQRRERDKSAFLQFRTDDGRFVFHSLRHAYITNLDRHGVNPTVKQALARHKDARMTQRYTHTAPKLLAEAAAMLPDRNVSAGQNLRATGTDDAMPKKGRTKIV